MSMGPRAVWRSRAHPCGSCVFIPDGSALAALQECRAREPFRALLNEIKEQMGRRSLELSDLLIMPVQRIPRYAPVLAPPRSVPWS